jgi:hypothetical protein
MPSGLPFFEGKRHGCFVAERRIRGKVSDHLLSKTARFDELTSETGIGLKKLYQVSRGVPMAKRVTPYGPPWQGGRREVLPFAKGELEGVVRARRPICYSFQTESTLDWVAAL